MKTTLIVLFVLLLLAVPVSAFDAIFEDCLAPYQPLKLTTVFPIEDGIALWSYETEDMQLIMVSLNLNTGEHTIIVNNLPITCVLVDHGNLPSITLYPLGGSHWTWAVQDDFGNWHTVKLLTGEIVQTPPEFDADGRMFTRLVVRRTEPQDPARYHVFDEFGALAG